MRGQGFCPFTAWQSPPPGLSPSSVCPAPAPKILGPTSVRGGDSRGSQLWHATGPTEHLLNIDYFLQAGSRPEHHGGSALPNKALGSSRAKAFLRLQAHWPCPIPPCLPDSALPAERPSLHPVIL